MRIKEYIIAFLSGALIVSLTVIAYLLKNVKPIINTDSYIESLEQKIGKIKQNGEGNVQDVTPTIEGVEQDKKIRKPFLGIRLRKKVV